MKKIAVYGTLKTGNHNSFLLLGAQSTGEITLSGVRLHQTTPSGWGNSGWGLPFAEITGDETHTTVVEVWEIPSSLEEEIMSAVDSLEGHPDWYTRVPAPPVGDNPTDVELYAFSGEVLRQYQEDSTLVPNGNWGVAA
jgi:gamma-glutamylcyclotransferase (GGCT)/AIG2-like uncharacterized protein YtfP